MARKRALSLVIQMLMLEVGVTSIARKKMDLSVDYEGVRLLELISLILFIRAQNLPSLSFNLQT